MICRTNSKIAAAAQTTQWNATGSEAGNPPCPKPKPRRPPTSSQDQPRIGGSRLRLKPLLLDHVQVDPPQRVVLTRTGFVESATCHGLPSPRDLA